MSSEKLPPADVEELKNELLQSESSAARNRAVFWILGGIWILALVLLFLLNAQTLNRLQETERQITKDQKRIAETEANLELLKQKQATRFAALERAYDSLWESKFGELSKDSQTSYVNQLASDVLGRRERTATEKRLLTQGTRGTGVAPQRVMLFAEAVGAIDKKDSEGALVLLDDYDRQGGSDAQSLLARGRALDLALDMKDAAEMYTRALGQDDLTARERVAAHAYRCLTRFRLAAAEGLGPYALREAEADCDASLDLDSRYWPSYNYRGLIRFLLNNDEGALTDWKEAASLLVDPRSKANPLENQSLVYLRQGEWQLALDTTEQVQEMAGDDSPWNWLFQWIAAERLGKTTLANVAEREWEERADESDRERLLVYLPKELHRYLRPASSR